MLINIIKGIASTRYSASQPEGFSAFTPRPGAYHVVEVFERSVLGSVSVPFAKCFWSQAKSTFVKSVTVEIELVSLTGLWSNGPKVSDVSELVGKTLHVKSISDYIHSTFDGDQRRLLLNWEFIEVPPKLLSDQDVFFSYFFHGCSDLKCAMKRFESTQSQATLAAIHEYENAPYEEDYTERLYDEIDDAYDADTNEDDDNDPIVTPK